MTMGGDWFEEGRDCWRLYTSAPHTKMVPMGMVKPVRVGLLRRVRYQAWVNVASRSDNALVLLTTERTLPDAKAVVEGRPVPQRSTPYGRHEA